MFYEYNEVYPYVLTDHYHGQPIKMFEYSPSEFFTEDEWDEWTAEQQEEHFMKEAWDNSIYEVVGGGFIK